MCFPLPAPSLPLRRCPTGPLRSPRPPIARQLVNQYGFVIRGNPFDRLQLGRAPGGGASVLPPALRAGRDVVQQAARALQAQQHLPADSPAHARLRCAAASVVDACGWR